jgi:hypothetical protein
MTANIAVPIAKVKRKLQISSAAAGILRACSNKCAMLKQFDEKQRAKKVHYEAFV